MSDLMLYREKNDQPRSTVVTVNLLHLELRLIFNMYLSQYLFTKSDLGMTVYNAEAQLRSPFT